MAIFLTQLKSMLIYSLEVIDITDSEEPTKDVCSLKSAMFVLASLLTSVWAHYRNSCIIHDNSVFAALLGPACSTYLLIPTVFSGLHELQDALSR